MSRGELNIYDRPEVLKKWASLLAELWIKVIKVALTQVNLPGILFGLK